MNVLYPNPCYNEVSYKGLQSIIISIIALRSAVRLVIEWLLVGVAPPAEPLCRVFEQATLSAA